MRFFDYFFIQNGSIVKPNNTSIQNQYVDPHIIFSSRRWGNYDIFITDIYSAGENELEDINKENLISALIAGGHKDAKDFENLEKLETFVKDNLEEGDVVIFLGAGDITQYARKFSDLLKGVEKKNV